MSAPNHCQWWLGHFRNTSPPNRAPLSSLATPESDGSSQGQISGKRSLKNMMREAQKLPCKLMMFGRDTHKHHWWEIISIYMVTPPPKIYLSHFLMVFTVLPRWRDPENKWTILGFVSAEIFLWILQWDSSLHCPPFGEILLVHFFQASNKQIQVNHNLSHRIHVGYIYLHLP